MTEPAEAVFDVAKVNAAIARTARTEVMWYLFMMNPSFYISVLFPLNAELLTT
jgi:hypothetical protein